MRKTRPNILKNQNKQPQKRRLKGKLVTGCRGLVMALWGVLPCLEKPRQFARTRVGVSHDSWCLVYQCATGSLVSNGAGGGKPDVCSIRRMIDRQVGQRWNKKGACWYLRYQHHVNAECACIFPATLLYCQCTGNEQEGSGAAGVPLDAKLPEWAGFVCCTLF